MTMNNSLEKPTDWALCPVAREIVAQQHSLDLVVGELLRAPEESIDSLLLTARALLNAVYQRPVGDEELAMHIDQTVWVLCDPEGAEAHFRAPRHDNSGVYDAIVQAA